MIYLDCDTASQEVHLTLFEGRIKLLPSLFTHYMVQFSNEQSGQTYYSVPVIDDETERMTTLLVDTTDILLAGRYEYVIFGQNSSTNIDPTDASVVGEVERGIAIFTDTNIYYETIETNAPADIVIS